MYLVVTRGATTQVAEATKTGGSKARKSKKPAVPVTIVEDILGLGKCSISTYNTIVYTLPVLVNR